MGKFIEIYLAAQADFQLTHDGVTIKVHRGSPPGEENGIPSVQISETPDESDSADVKAGANNASHLYIPTNVRAPLYAVRLQGEWNIEPDHETAHE